MKSFSQLLLTAIVATFILTSCSIEKRKYLSGYHVEWNNGKSGNVKSVAVQKENMKNSDEEVLINTDASQQEVLFVSAKEEIILDKTPKITVQQNPVSYENRAINLDAKSESIAEIKAEKRGKAKMEKSSSGGDNQVVALLLCIFLGALGVHRFYLGYIGIGILMLFTLGLFGILWLIDLIRIVTGDLEPKDGSYSETL